MIKPLISIQEARSYKSLVSASGSNMTVGEKSNYIAFSFQMNASSKMWNERSLFIEVQVSSTISKMFFTFAKKKPKKHLHRNSTRQRILRNELACCIFWPAFGCCPLQLLVKIFFLQVLTCFCKIWCIIKETGGKKEHFWVYSQGLVDTKMLL